MVDQIFDNMFRLSRIMHFVFSNLEFFITTSNQNMKNVARDLDTYIYLHLKSKYLYLYI